MSLFDTLFPQQRRASERHRPEDAGQAKGRNRTAAGRNRLRHLGHGEQLERRDLLAVSVVQETPTTFFTDFSRNFNSEYASYTITNIDSGTIDAWVKVSFPAGSVVGLGPGYNNEDGLYRVGTLNNGDSNEAFLYYTAKSNTAVAQPYSLEVWNGKPGDPGSSPLTPSPIALTYESIVDTLAAESNKVSSVTISPAAPAVGDIMTMTVAGKLGSGANRVLFAPATRSDWQPDIFELRDVTNVISGITRTPDRIFYDGLPGGGSDEKPFTSVYEFLVTGPITTPTPVDPTQWTQDGKQPWKHHKPDDTPFPPISPITYELSISKTDGKATYTPGGTTTYTVTLLNTGKAAANNVLVTDVLPPQVDPTSTWTVTYSGGATSGPLPGGLGNGGTGNISGTVNLAALTGSVVITINAKILPGASGAMTNTVTAQAPGDGPISASDTNLDVNLSLTKDDGVTTYTPGGTTTYTIVLQNTGLAELNGITLKDELPDQIDQSSTWSAVYSGGASSGTLGNNGTGDFIDKTVNLGGLGGTVTITINAKILSSATGQMTNTIFATFATGGPPLSASDTNAPIPDDRLTLTKDNGQTTYVPGTTTTYTIVLSNIGLSDVNGIIVSDTLPVQLDPLTTTWFATYTNASGTLPTVPTTGDILGTVTTLKGSVGVVTITINGNILSTATGDMVNTVTARNSVSLSATDRDTATPQVNLSVTKTDGTDTYIPGTSTTYTITINNSGPSFLDNGTISDLLPAPVAIAGTWTVFSSSGVGTLVTPSNGTGSISANLDLAAGGQVVIKYTVDTDSAATAPLINTVIVTPPQGQGSSTSDTDEDTAAPQVDLAVTKTRTSPLPVIAGEVVTYSIVVSSNGPSSITTFSGTDISVPGLLSPTYSVSTGTYNPNTGIWTANPGDTFDDGESVTFTLSGTVPAGATGTLTNTATGTPPIFDPNPNNNTSTATDTIVVKPVLTVTKTDGSATYIPGDPVTYTIVVSNSGPSDLVGGSVVDLLPSVATSGSWTTSTTGGATVLPTTGGNNINATVNIPKNGSVTFTYTVQTKPIVIPIDPVTGPYPDLFNLVTVFLPPGTTGNTATATDNDTAAPQVDLAVTKTRTSAPPVIAGEVVTYSIVVSSNGPSSITTFTGADTSVPGLLSPTYSVSTGTYNPNNGIWTANPGDTFDEGESVTFTFSGTVPADATGTLTNTVTGTPPIFDPNPDNNTSTATDTIVVKPVLSISKTDGKGTYVPGTSTTYTIVATNAGPSFLAGGTVSDPLPAQVSSATWTAVYSAGSSGPETGSGPLNETVNLAPGGTATFTFTVQIKPDATGDLVNTVTITPPPNTQGNTATATDTNTLSSPQLLLDVTKTDGKTTYLPNETFTYTMVVSNSGPSTMIDGVVNDPLPAQVATASWTASYSAGSSGSPSGSGGITNEKITLLPGGNATFLLTVTIKPDAFGQMDNVVTLTPPAGVVVTPGSVLTATDTNFGPEPPQSIGGALVVGSDDGCNGPPWVRVLDPDSGEELSRFLAYDSRFRGSVRVATGDVTGDGVAEIITAPSRNAIGEVRVFQQALGGWAELTQYRTLAFGPRYRGGVEVAVADIDGDGDNDIVTGMSIQSGMVNVFRVNTGVGVVDPVANTPFKSFRGAPAGTNNGVMISAGDYILGGPAEIAVGTNSGTRALVRVFDVSGAPTVVRSFKPFANNFRGGVTLSTSDYDGNGSLDLIVGAGLNGGSRVEVWNPSTTTRIAQISAFGSLSKPNARVFAVFGSVADGFIGPNSALYGVQGLNGGRGSKGVWRVNAGTLNPLVNSQGSLPPLRIAPIALQLG